MLRWEVVRIYLDHNATTPVDPAVVDAMVGGACATSSATPPVCTTSGSRPRPVSIAPGRRSRASSVAIPSEIMFTSGGTEADVLALRGAAEALESTGRRHFVTTPIEHEAVLQTVEGVDAARLARDAARRRTTGLVEPRTLEAALTPRTRHSSP